MRNRLVQAMLGMLVYASAAIAPAADVVVSEAWAKETLPGQKVGAVYLTIKSAVAARLVGGGTARAGRVEIHEMRHEGDVMKMRKLDALTLPAGSAVTLSPGATHLMLMDLTQPLKPGETVQLSLEIEQAGKRSSVEVAAPVVALTDPRNAPRHH